MTSVVVLQIACVFAALLLSLQNLSKTSKIYMSESEHSSTDSSSEGNEAMSGSDGETTGGLFVFKSGNFAPYQGEPLATANNADEGSRG